jgi:hypothetical protein
MHPTCCHTCLLIIQATINDLERQVAVTTFGIYYYITTVTTMELHVCAVFMKQTVGSYVCYFL